MVDARNANYAIISRYMCFGKRGVANPDTEQDSSGKPERGQGSGAADTIDNGSDSDTEAPEPKLLRVG